MGNRKVATHFIIMETKYTDEELMVVYNSDDDYTSDLQMARVLGVGKTSFRKRRVKLRLRAKSYPHLQKTPEEITKTIQRAKKRYRTKYKERNSKYQKAYRVAHIL